MTLPPPPALSPWERSVALPILRGSLRGRLWLPASRGKVLRILLGTYEAEQTALFFDTVRPGWTVLDVGAHAGYYALLASDRVGPQGRVAAFEAHPRNAAFLREHVRLNRLANVQVVEAAVARAPGRARFGGGTGTGTGRLDPRGDFEVEAVSLDAFCAGPDKGPDAVKLDVEGAELDVLEGSRQVLRGARPALFLSTHGPEVHRKCLDFLRPFGYAFRPMAGQDLETATEVLCLPA